MKAKIYDLVTWRSLHGTLIADECYIIWFLWSVVVDRHVSLIIDLISIARHCCTIFVLILQGSSIVGCKCTKQVALIAMELVFVVKRVDFKMTPAFGSEVQAYECNCRDADD